METILAIRVHPNKSEKPNKCELKEKEKEKEKNRVHSLKSAAWYVNSVGSAASHHHFVSKHFKEKNFSKNKFKHSFEDVNLVSIKPIFAA